MKVNIKKLNPNAIIPSYAKQGDAGLDLTSIGLYQPQKNEDGTGIVSYSTGLAIEIPEGYVGLLFPRSSVADTSLTLANCVGVIDSGYRGHLYCTFKTIDSTNTIIKERVVEKPATPAKAEPAKEEDPW